MELFARRKQEAQNLALENARHLSFRGRASIQALIAGKYRVSRVPLSAAAIWVVLYLCIGLAAGLPRALPSIRTGTGTVSSTSSPSSLPAGTILYLRLKTPVSTTTSRLNAPMKAEVVRDIDGKDGVAVPLGAIVTGKIAKLIPSSNPSDRPAMGFEFDAIQMPGLSPERISCRLSKVKNAREAVLANGTIQGVLGVCRR